MIGSQFHHPYNKTVFLFQTVTAHYAFCSPLVYGSQLDDVMLAGQDLGHTHLAHVYHYRYHHHHFHYHA